MDSFFVLIRTWQHCVAKICDASPRATHKLQNAMFTISSSILYTYFLPKTCIATSVVLGCKETKCHNWCLKKQNVSVAGQGIYVHWTGSTHIHYTVLMTPNKEETVVHCFFLIGSHLSAVLLNNSG